MLGMFLALYKMKLFEACSLCHCVIHRLGDLEKALLLYFKKCDWFSAQHLRAAHFGVFHWEGVRRRAVGSG